MTDQINNAFAFLDDWVQKYGDKGYIPEWFINGFHPGKDWPIQQTRSELYSITCEFEKKQLINGTILEIGLGNYGGTHMLWKKLFSKVITLECDQQWIDRLLLNNRDLLNNNTCVINDFNFDLQLINNIQSIIINGYSYDPDLIELVKKITPKVDVLFIDGEHRYNPVKLDTKLYSPFVRSGGMVVWHDAISRGWEVYKYLQDFAIGKIDNNLHNIKYVVSSDDIGIAYEIIK